MSRRFVSVVFGVVLAGMMFGGCGPREVIIISVDGEKGKDEAGQMAVAEVVVRHMLVNVPPGEEALVSFGTNWDDPVDPPEGFLGRLDDIPARFGPVSSYREGTDHTPLLLVVHITRWAGESVAEVHAVRYRYGIGASDGFTATVTWRDGAWRVSEKRKSWAR